jgi:phage gp36-like protein
VAAYATLADLGTYGLPGPVLADIDTGQQTNALESASRFADGYLHSQYTLPLLVPYPTDLVSAVCKVAAYELLSVRGFNPDLGGDANIRARYKDAVDWLNQVGLGHISPNILDSSPGQNPNVPYIVQAYTSPDTTNADGTLLALTRKPSPRGWV